MRQIALTAALVLSLAASPERAAAETAKEVIEKAIEAHGGAENLKKYQAARVTTKGKLSIMGLEIPIESESSYMLPDMGKNVLKMEILGQKVAITQVMNAGKFKVTVSDMSPPLSDAQKGELKEAVELQAVQNLWPLLDDKTYELSLLEKADKVKDKEVVGVLVKSKKFKDITLYFDKNSNLLVKLKRKGLDPTEMEVDQEIFLMDHKKYDGIMRPVKSEVLMDGKKFMESEVVEYKHLDKIDKKEFDISD